MIILNHMTVLNQHADFKQKQLYPAQNPTSNSPLVSWGQHIEIFYVVILLHVYDEQKGSLPGNILVKPEHYLENSLIFMIFQSLI